MEISQDTEYDAEQDVERDLEIVAYKALRIIMGDCE
jgi:hypothetical protein